MKHNFQKIFRPLVCLVLVCCILVGVSPVKTNAVIDPFSVLILQSMAEPLAYGIAMGLGISIAADLIDAAQTFSSHIVDYLSSDQFKEDFERTAYFSAATQQYYVSQELVTAVQDYLWSSGVVSSTLSVTTRGFSGTLLGSTESYGPFYSVNFLANKYPSEMTNLFRNLGILKDVAVFNITSSSPYYLVGMYWGEDGRLMQGIFENSLGMAHASLYGVYSFGDLVLVDSGLVQLHVVGYSGYSCGVFYNTSYAEAMPDFLTSRYLAVDWSYDFVYQNFGQYTSSYELGIRCYMKEAVNSSWNASSAYYGKYSAPECFYKSYYIGSSDITWDEVSTTIISVAEGYEQDFIAAADVGLVAGYPEWSANSVVIPADYSGTGSDVVAYPVILGDSVADMQNYSQSDIWTGYYTGSSSGSDSGNTGTGTGSGTTVDIDLTSILSALSTITEYQQSGQISMESGFSTVSTDLEGIRSDLEEGNTWLEVLAGTMAGTYTEIESLPGAIGDTFSDVITDVGTITGTTTDINEQVGVIGGVLSDILNGVLSLPQSIGDVMSEVLTSVLTAAFAPSETFVDSKVEALAAYFPFAASVVGTVRSLENRISNMNQEPPVIRIPLYQAGGNWAGRPLTNSGSSDIFIDFGWFAPYIDDIRFFLSSIIWVVFCWRSFMGLPALFSGSSAGFVMGRIEDHYERVNAPASIGHSSRPIAYDDSGTKYHRKGGRHG